MRDGHLHDLSPVGDGDPVVRAFEDAVRAAWVSSVPPRLGPQLQAVLAGGLARPRVAGPDALHTLGVATNGTVPRSRPSPAPAAAPANGATPAAWRTQATANGSADHRPIFSGNLAPVARQARRGVRPRLAGGRLAGRRGRHLLGIAAASLALVGTGSIGGLPGPIQAAFERATQTIRLDIPARSDDEGPPTTTTTAPSSDTGDATGGQGAAAETSGGGPPPTAPPMAPADPGVTAPVIAPRTAPPTGGAGVTGDPGLDAFLQWLAELLEYVLENVPPGAWTPGTVPVVTPEVPPEEPPSDPPSNDGNRPWDGLRPRGERDRPPADEAYPWEWPRR